MDKDPDEIPIADWIKTRSPMARAKRLVDGGSATGDLLIENAELHTALAAAQARIAELERMVVWLSRRQRLWDGTPDSILAAVEKAMGGEK